MSSEGKRLPVSAGWKDRALEAEAEVERLRAERDRHAQTVASLSAEVERLREALGNLQQAAGSLLEADPPSRGDGRFLEHNLLLCEQQARAALADDEKEEA